GVAEVFAVSPEPLDRAQRSDPLIDVSRAVGAGERVSNQIRQGAALPARHLLEPPVERLVQIELRPDHAMYIHRRNDSRKGDLLTWEAPAIARAGVCFRREAK